MADILAPILLKLWQVGSKKAKQFIEDGLIRTADDLEKLPQEDLLVIKNIRDQEVLNAAKKRVNPKQQIVSDDIDIFADEIVQDTTDEIKLSNQDIINAANSLPSKETLNNPFFGSFYKDNIDYMNVKNRAENLKKLMADPEPQDLVQDMMKKNKMGKFSDEDSIFRQQRARGSAMDSYVANRLEAIKKENPAAIPTDGPNFNSFMQALDNEAADLIKIETLDNLPEVTSAIPDYKVYPKTKKQSMSEFTGTSFQEDYKNRIYSIWKDKIPDIRAGHELMITRRKEIGDEAFLNQVKYPVFFTNATRNSAHIRLENALVLLRDEKIKLTSSLTPLRIRNSNRIKEIDRVIKNIKHDMTELGLETRLYDPKTKKFKKYGKAYESPTQLYNSMQKKQKLNYLGSSDEISQKKPAYVSFEEEGVFLPEGYEEGGFASIEEVLEY